MQKCGFLEVQNLVLGLIRQIPNFQPLSNVHLFSIVILVISWAP